jgi:hypothetical protein
VRYLRLLPVYAAAGSVYLPLRGMEFAFLKSAGGGTLSATG